MDKSNQQIIRMLLDGHYKRDKQKRETIRLFTGKKISPVTIEAFKNYLSNKNGVNGIELYEKMVKKKAELEELKRVPKKET